jgi:hypothetical protein
MLFDFLSVLAIYGIYWFISESDLMSGIRNFLFLRSAFLTKLLTCSFCCSFWCALLVFFLHQWAYGVIFIWGFGGAAIGHLLHALYLRISWIRSDMN